MNVVKLLLRLSGAQDHKPEATLGGRGQRESDTETCFETGEAGERAKLSSWPREAENNQARNCSSEAPTV